MKKTISLSLTIIFLFPLHINADFMDHFDDAPMGESWEITNFEVLDYSIDTSWFVVTDGSSGNNPDFSTISRGINEYSDFELVISSYWNNPSGQNYQLLYIKLLDTITNEFITYNLRSYKQGDNVIEYNYGQGLRIIDIPDIFYSDLIISRTNDSIGYYFGDSLLEVGLVPCNFNRLEVSIGQSSYYLIGTLGIDYIQYVGLACGDANSDGTLNILDVTYLIKFLYLAGPPPENLDYSDVDSTGYINILDITYLIAYLYHDGPNPSCP